MKKNTLVFILLIISCLFVGCSNDNALENYPLFNNVENCYIENNTDKPLQIENLDNESYNSLLSNIESYSRLSSRFFELSNLKEWMSSAYFRKSETEDDIYYCIISHDKYKAFLFFEELSDWDIYRCLNYITITEDKISYSLDGSYDYYSMICDIDL